MNPETILLEILRALEALKAMGRPITQLDTRLSRADAEARRFFASKGIHVTEKKPDLTAHASTSPGPTNCLLRITEQEGRNQRQPIKCERCGAIDRQGCIFFEPDGARKK